MECAICFEMAEPFILPCNHSVCFECYKNIKMCPFCRKKIRETTIHHVHIQIHEPYVEQPFLTKEACSIFLCITCLITLVWLSLGIGSVPE